MQNINYPYGLFNTGGIAQYSNLDVTRQIEQNEQQKHILEMTKAIRDYCEAARQIKPEYQQLAFVACFTELENQMNRG